MPGRFLLVFLFSVVFSALSFFWASSSVIGLSCIILFSSRRGLRLVVACSFGGGFCLLVVRLGGPFLSNVSPEFWSGLSGLSCH